MRVPKPQYLYGSLRRRFIYYLRKGYVKQQMARRRGQCDLAGHCCKKTIPWCKNLKEGKCAIYTHQPLFCRIFPIDEKDQELSGVKGTCSYFFTSTIDHRPSAHSYEDCTYQPSL